MLIPIYRPEVTVHSKAPDGVWESSPVFTNTLFFPMPDEDGTEVRASGLRRTVEHGESPAVVIEAPDGSEFFKRGTATFLRTPDGKVHDAINATIFAKTRAFGFAVHDPDRASRPLPAFEPRPRASRPAVQLAMF